jgi:BirA family biotin operon repressor/biotin-[acetyl-CoA-carboxylase] ligase
MGPGKPTATDLTAERITAALRGDWGRPLMALASTGSTNDEALRWGGAGAPEGAVVVADHQTEGRGRRGRTWWSEPGGSLLFSVVLRPARPPRELGLLSTTVGVACARGIENLAPVRVGLKWPNDLMVGGRKLGGILVETRVSESNVIIAVAGIGINVFHLSAAPAAVATHATSLAAEIGRQPPERPRLLASILVALENLYTSPDVSGILAEATTRSEILGRRVVVTRADGTTFEGDALTLLSSGALELEVGTEKIAVSSGDVETVRTPE